MVLTIHRRYPCPRVLAGPMAPHLLPHCRLKWTVCLYVRTYVRTLVSAPISFEDIPLVLYVCLASTRTCAFARVCDHAHERVTCV